MAFFLEGWGRLVCFFLQKSAFLFFGSLFFVQRKKALPFFFRRGVAVASPVFRKTGNKQSELYCIWQCVLPLTPVIATGPIAHGSGPETTHSQRQPLRPALKRGSRQPVERPICSTWRHMAFPRTPAKSARPLAHWRPHGGIPPIARC
jgi:hypothetical protein